jgi:hypothetical protein
MCSFLQLDEHEPSGADLKSTTNDQPESHIEERSSTPYRTAAEALR